MPMLYRQFAPFEDLGRITRIGHALDQSKLMLVTDQLQAVLGERVDHLVVNITAPGAELLAFGAHAAMTAGQPVLVAHLEVGEDGQPIDYDGEVMCSGLAFGQGPA